jgi:DNA-binding beta-propeller fold protein YncE
MLLAAAMLMITAASTRLNADTGACGGASITLPFTDVVAGNIFFCSIAEAFLSGLTNGTGATTYSPSASVPREQMAAFITRTMDQSVKRSSKRAALNQFWTNQGDSSLANTLVGTGPRMVASDGEDLWVASDGSPRVSQVHASNGKLIGDWPGAQGAFGVLVAIGKVFVTGQTNPGHLYQIDPVLPPGPVATLTTSLGAFPLQLAFDGQRIWTANQGPPGSISIVSLGPPLLIVTTVTTGFIQPFGIIYDGANIWVTDSGDSQLKQLDSTGTVLMSASVGSVPLYPGFDGTNIWVPNHGSDSVSVVRATGAFAGTVLATLTGNGLDGPQQAAFDGERILVTNNDGNSVSLWKASDLTPIGNFSTGANPFGAFGVCSDGLNFWITIFNANSLARF